MKRNRKANCFFLRFFSFFTSLKWFFDCERKWDETIFRALARKAILDWKRESFTTECVFEKRDLFPLFHCLFRNHVWIW
jgi:hypothetical protein